MEEYARLAQEEYFRRQEEYTRLIAEFMGATFYDIGDGDVIVKVEKPFVGSLTICKFDDLRYYKSWEWIMPVCKKIIEMYFAEREKIFTGLHKIDNQMVFEGCAEFIKFWNDPTQEKLTWTSKDELRAPFSQEQIDNLITRQVDGQYHPYTCANDGDQAHILYEFEQAHPELTREDYSIFIQQELDKGVPYPDASFKQTTLIPITDGLMCPVCGYLQTTARISPEVK